MDHPKSTIQIVISMHPNDIYDFLADNGADPWKPEILSHDYLIQKLFEFINENAENHDLLIKWFEYANA